MCEGKKAWDFFLIGERDKLRVASFDVLDCGIKIRCNFIECINALIVKRI